MAFAHHWNKVPNKAGPKMCLKHFVSWEEKSLAKFKFKIWLRSNLRLVTIVQILGLVLFGVELIFFSMLSMFITLFRMIYKFTYQFSHTLWPCNFSYDNKAWWFDNWADGVIIMRDDVIIIPLHDFIAHIFCNKYCNFFVSMYLTSFAFLIISIT